MLSEAQLDARRLKKYLRDLTKAVSVHLMSLDAVMREKESRERGSKVAILANNLDLQNDIAIRYGLGVTKKRRKPLTPSGGSP